MKVTIHYRTDLTEKQWQIIKRMIPQQKKGTKQVLSTPHHQCHPLSGANRLSVAKFAA